MVQKSCVHHHHHIVHRYLQWHACAGRTPLARTRPSTTQSGFEARALGAVTRAKNSRAERLCPEKGENCTTTLLRCFSTIQSRRRRQMLVPPRCRCFAARQWLSGIESLAYSETLLRVKAGCEHEVAFTRALLQQRACCTSCCLLRIACMLDKSAF